VPEALPSAAPVAVAAALPLGSASAAAVAAFNSAAVPFVRLATMFWMDEPLASVTPSVEEPSTEASSVELLAAVACPAAAGCCWTPAITAASDCARKPKVSAAVPLSALEDLAPPVTSSGAAVATVLTLSAACACDCASASMKLGPSELLDAPAAVWAPGPEPVVDWV
jgi:hypothetical protein